MDRYKKRSINFSKNVENRELRAHRRSVDRQNAKHKRLSVLRQLDEKIVENSLQETPLKLQESSRNKVYLRVVLKADMMFQGSASHIPLVNASAESRHSEKQKKPSRIEMLQKWKAEKELRKKLEAKKQKPVFKVSHIKYNPPPVLNNLHQSVSKNSKLQEKAAHSSIPRPVASKAKTTIPDSSRITRSKVSSMQVKEQGNLVYNRLNNQVSKNQTQGLSSTVKASLKYLPNIAFRNKGISNATLNKKQKAQLSSAVTKSLSTTQEVPDLDFTCEISRIEPHSSVSFAPSNFLFTAPENLTSVVLSSIFDYDTKKENTGVLRRVSTPRKPKLSHNEKPAVNTHDLCSSSNAEGHQTLIPKVSLKDESIPNNSKPKDVDEASASDQILPVEHKDIDSPFTCQYFVEENIKEKNIQETKNFVSNETVDKNCLSIQQNALVLDETTVLKCNECSGNIPPNSKKEENVEIKVESTLNTRNSSLEKSQNISKDNIKGLRSEQGLSTGLKDSIFNMLLETIDENVEDGATETGNDGMQTNVETDVTNISENVKGVDDANKEKNNINNVRKTEWNKENNNTVNSEEEYKSSVLSLEVEKSKRVKSRMSVNKAKEGSSELNQTPRRSARLSSIYANSPTPLDSRFFQKSDSCVTPENNVIGIRSAGLAAFLEDTPQTVLSHRLAKLSMNQSLTSHQDEETRVRRPQTRSQAHDRISLLGSPQRRLTRSQKIVNGDLISFSPSVKL